MYDAQTSYVSDTRSCGGKRTYSRVLIKSSTHVIQIKVKGCCLYTLHQQSKQSQEERASKGTPPKNMTFIQEENDGNRSKGASKLVSVCQEVQTHIPHCKRRQQNK